MLDVNHLRGDGDEVAQGPRVGRQGEGGVVRDVSDGAGEDYEEGEEGESRGGRLGAEDDEGVDVGVAEEVGVGEDGEVEDDGGGEETLGGGEGEGVVAEEAEFAEEEDGEGGG